MKEWEKVNKALQDVSKELDDLKLKRKDDFERLYKMVDKEKLHPNRLDDQAIKEYLKTEIKKIEEG